MTQLVLVRHAAHDWVGRGIAGRLPDVALNAQGRAQAQRIADALGSLELATLYSSPQQRARETAGAIAQRLGLQVQIAAEFDEIDFGEWTGRSLAELDAGAAGWRDWVERRSTAAPPGGEPFAQVRERVVEGAQRLNRAHPSGTVVVVSHADVIKALIATHLGLSLDDLERFEIDCASLSVIELQEGWSKVRCVNCPRLPAPG